jgi:hypothetical protein
MEYTGRGGVHKKILYSTFCLSYFFTILTFNKTYVAYWRIDWKETIVRLFCKKSKLNFWHLSKVSDLYNFWIFCNSKWYLHTLFIRTKNCLIQNILLRDPKYFQFWIVSFLFALQKTPLTYFWRWKPPHLTLGWNVLYI